MSKNRRRRKSSNKSPIK